MKEYIEKLKELLVEYTPKILVALAILIIGLFVIKIVVNTSKKVLKKRGVDETLQKFLGDLLSWTLKILLIITVIVVVVY